MRTPLLVLAFCLASTSAAAAPSATPIMDACLDSGDAARGVTPAMAACVWDEHERQDAKLNAAYRRAMQRLPPAAQKRLRTEERAWIKRRDKTCDEEASSGGTIDRINRPMCMVNETMKRTGQLERMR